jgi:hypothetical protein
MGPWCILAAKAEGTSEQRRRNEALDAQWAVVRNRIQVRQTIVDEVLAGRMTVAEAVVRFQELNRMSPHCMALLRQAHPGESDEQCVRRQVWRYLQSALEERPAEARAIRQRLEAEQIDSEDVSSASRLPESPPH